MTEAWYYKPGDYYVLDDLSGFKIRHSRARRIPGGQTGGALVETKRWEPQHPQDFVRGIVDDMMVPEARPRQKNRFMIVGSWVTQPAPRLTRTIVVDSTEGFQTGHKVAVMLDTGDNYFPTIIGIRPGNQLVLSLLLPHGVGGNFANPLENTVVDLGISDAQPFLVSDGTGEPFITDDGGNLLSTP